jgi:hypothetical protein
MKFVDIADTSAESKFDHKKRLAGVMSLNQPTSAL